MGYDPSHRRASSSGTSSGNLLAGRFIEGPFHTPMVKPWAKEPKAKPIGQRQPEKRDLSGSDERAVVTTAKSSHSPSLAIASAAQIDHGT